MNRHSYIELPKYGNRDEATRTPWHEDVKRRKIGYANTSLWATITIFLFAVPTLIAAAYVLLKTRHKSDGHLLSTQSIPVMTGLCNSNLSTYNLVAHFVINLIGTLILGCSNYLQHICASPNIFQIKKRLGRRKDIWFGTNSPTAVMHQRFGVILFWIFLVLTSLPLHVMINGIMGYAVTPIDAGCQAIQETVADVTTRPSYATNWTIVTSDQCAQLLLDSIAYVTDFNNITVLVNPNPSAPFSFYNDFLSEAGQSRAYIPKASDISICYVQETESQCQLTVRWFPLLITASALFLKFFITIIFLFSHEHFRYRVFNCLGDMIALGARHPSLRFYAHHRNPLDRPYDEKMKIKWKSALGFWDALVIIAYTIVGLAVTGLGVYLWIAVGKEMSWSERFKRFGLGTVDPETSVVPGKSTYQDANPDTFPVLVLIANSPQLFFSIGYLFWNNQITRIYMEHEWRSFYETKGKKPRVSYSIEDGDHRLYVTSMWLQLPVTITVIWMLLNSVMHWLLSQTLFVVEILPGSIAPANFYLNYSPPAIFTVGIVATVVAIGMIIFIFWPQQSKMPLMNGSLLVVLQSCLHLKGDDIPSSGVSWGDISRYAGHGTLKLAGFGSTVDPMKNGAEYGTVLPHVMPWEDGYERPGTASSSRRQSRMLSPMSSPGLGRGDLQPLMEDGEWDGGSGHRSSYRSSVRDSRYSFH
jgi:hypothetical protein